MKEEKQGDNNYKNYGRLLTLVIPEIDQRIPQRYPPTDINKRQIWINERI